MDLIELRSDSQIIIDLWIKQIYCCRASLVWYKRRSIVL